jgi:broad specificity phosphatase PhoE
MDNDLKSSRIVQIGMLVLFLWAHQGSSFSMPHGGASFPITILRWLHSVTALAGGSRTSIASLPRTSIWLSAVQHAETVYYSGEVDWDAEYVRAKQATVPAVQIVSAMPETLGPQLHNHYYLLRHGQSTANVAEVISSDRFTLAYATKHGLTETGYQQGRDAATQLLDQLQPMSRPGDRIVFVSSPFARARQTAKACLDALQKENHDRVISMQLTLDDSILLNDLLVERSFGRLDNEAIYTYAYVWPLDKFNATHTAFDVESVAAVCTRLRQLVLELEERYTVTSAATATATKNHIVLVSHADVLQIAQLYAAHATNVGEFSSFRFQSKYGSSTAVGVCGKRFLEKCPPSDSLPYWLWCADGEVRRMKMADTTDLPDPVPLEKPDRSTRQG